MKLGQVNEITDHKIIGGSDYQWNCYPDARYLDYQSTHANLSVLFNIYSQEIYSAEINDNEDTVRYRWLNPAYKDAMVAEAKERNVDPDQAWDDVKWTDLEVEEDFLEKAQAIFAGKEFDNRIQVPLDLEDDLLLHLAMEAHKRDITLNKMVEIVLQEAINRHRNEDLMR